MWELGEKSRASPLEVTRLHLCEAGILVSSLGLSFVEDTLFGLVLKVDTPTNSRPKTRPDTGIRQHS